MKYKYLYVSFILTLVTVMFLTGGLIVLESLLEYTSTGDYVFFNMNDKLSGTLLNRPYSIDISGFVSILNRLQGFVPNTLRAISLMYEELKSLIYSALDYIFY